MENLNLWNKTDIALGLHPTPTTKLSRSDPHPYRKNSGSARVTASISKHSLAQEFLKWCLYTFYILFTTVPPQEWAPQACNRLETADIDIRKDPRWRDLFLICRKMNIFRIFMNTIYWLYISNRVTINHNLNKTLTFTLSPINIYAFLHWQKTNFRLCVFDLMNNS